MHAKSTIRIMTLKRSSKSNQRLYMKKILNLKVIKMEKTSSQINTNQSELSNIIKIIKQAQEQDNYKIYTEESRRLKIDSNSFRFTKLHTFLDKRRSVDEQIDSSPIKDSDVKFVSKRCKTPAENISTLAQRK